MAVRGYSLEKDDYGKRLRPHRRSGARACSG